LGRCLVAPVHAFFEEGLPALAVNAKVFVVVEAAGLEKEYFKVPGGCSEAIGQGCARWAAWDEVVM